MAGGLLFVSQALLDTWAGQGRIGLDGATLELLSGDGRGRRYALEPAVRFLRVADGGEDPEGLVARVKTLAQVQAIGGEAMAGSVVLGNLAYDVEEGFLAEASALEAASRVAPAAAQPGPRDPSPPADLDERKREAEALARFLLDNLS